MIECKCKDCDHRTERCHSTCEDYIKFCEERKKFNQKMKEENLTLAAQTRASLSQALIWKKIKGGRR